MRRGGRTVLLLGLLSGALAAGPTAVANPASSDRPHGFMDDETRCAGCHRVEKEGADHVLDAHIFTGSVVEKCRTCHPVTRVGRSHPVGMDPLRALKVKALPPDLPLQLVDGERVELMTCGTCHNPHQPRFTRQRLFPRQQAYPGRPGEYLTFYLRIKKPNPKEGFTSLCRACHPKL